MEKFHHLLPLLLQRQALPLGHGATTSDRRGGGSPKTSKSSPQGQGATCTVGGHTPWTGTRAACGRCWTTPVLSSQMQAGVHPKVGSGMGSGIQLLRISRVEQNILTATLTSSVFVATKRQPPRPCAPSFLDLLSSDRSRLHSRCVHDSHPKSHGP